MQRIRGIMVCLAFGAGMLGCSVSPLPPPKLPHVSRRTMPDSSLVVRLREAWSVLGQVDVPEEQRQELIRCYNADLLCLLRRLRHDIMQEGGDAPYPLFIEGAPRRNLSGKLAQVYDDVVPAADVRLDTLKERYLSPGLGVPIVGVIPHAKLRERVATFQTRGTVHTMTALLEFRGAHASPVFRFVPQQEASKFRVGKMMYQLAADYSSSIELYWALSGVDRDKILGLLRPQNPRNQRGLVCMEPCDPNRIPVIFVHGLASSAATFANLVNRLRSHPDLREKYQFWYFNYPTGVAWTLSAAAYRKALEDARAEFDPRHRNVNWDRLVVVGHSMGGLITHYSQCTEPWKLLEAVPKDRTLFGDLLLGRYTDAPPAVVRKNGLTDVFYFKPVKAGMVVYMATPHKGAPIARNRFVLMLTHLIYLPQSVISETLNIATLQRDNVITDPRRLTRWFTSIRQLSPDSYAIRGLTPLAVRNVPIHSIIGDRGRGDTPRSSDGIVPYWSSHLSRGTETIVPSDHSVQDAKEAADDLARLLRENPGQ